MTISLTVTICGKQNIANLNATQSIGARSRGSLGEVVLGRSWVLTLNSGISICEYAQRQAPGMEAHRSGVCEGTGGGAGAN